MGNLIRRCCDDPPEQNEESGKKEKRNPKAKSASVHPLQEMSNQVILMDPNNSSLFKENPGKKEKIKSPISLNQSREEKVPKRKNPAKMAPAFLEDFTKFSPNVSGVETEGHAVKSPPVNRSEFSSKKEIKSSHKEMMDKSIEYLENESIIEGTPGKVDQSFSRASSSFNCLNTSMSTEKKKKKKRRLPPMSKKFFGDEYTDSTVSRNHAHSCLPTPTPPTNYQKTFFD